MLCYAEIQPFLANKPSAARYDEDPVLKELLVKKAKENHVAIYEHNFKREQSPTSSNAGSMK